VAVGGTTDQVLAKNSGTDFDTKWVNPAAGGGGSEVEISTTDPIGTNPTAELWYDSDASDAIGGPEGPMGMWRKSGDQNLTSPGINTVLGPMGTITHIAGRRYKFTIEILVSSTTTNDLVAVYLRNVGDGLTYRRWLIGPLGNLFGTFVMHYINEASISGAQTWRVDAERSSGSGTITMYGSGITPHATPASAPRWSWIMVEDAGAL